ncbi:2630_t:CDS:1 [Ambispora gerdemannii]|uniref:2630_t:CDS:1 n=1 Tax=Ambispora gerdemannii TaxID=144530 RepID=A0A9N8VWW5_9GLOM|nr:2630_t:CDS:1 [Ambispora gerdemannii]
MNFQIYRQSANKIFNHHLYYNTLLLTSHNKLCKFVNLYNKRNDEQLDLIRNFSNSLPFFVTVTSFRLAQSPGRPRRDEEIDIPFVNFVNTEGKMEGIRSTKELLSTINRGKYWLVEVSPNANPPVCKLVDKKETFAKQKTLKQKSKVLLHSGHLKEVQLSWSVSDNDFSRKLSKAKEFLQKGYNLKIIVKTRKGGNRPSPQDEKSMHKRIVDALTEYAKEIKVPDFGKGTLTIDITGKGLLLGDTKKIEANDTEK